jgi:hypothetical protein
MDALGAWGRHACTLVSRLCGRESIFLFSHTNEFCGNSKVALEAGVAWSRLKWGRRVCEKGANASRLGKRESVEPGGWRLPTSQSTVPYLAETRCGAPSTACRLLVFAGGESPAGIAPHEAGGLPHGVLGMPNGGGRFVLPSPTDGLCG